MTPNLSSRPNLCFVESRQLNAPLTDRLDVWTAEGRRIGSLEGIVVDSEEQRACYLVVDRGRYRPNHCLIPLPVRLDVVHQALRVETDDLNLEELPEFDARSYGHFAASRQPTTEPGRSH